MSLKNLLFILIGFSIYGFSCEPTEYSLLKEEDLNSPIYDVQARLDWSMQIDNVRFATYANNVLLVYAQQELIGLEVETGKELWRTPIRNLQKDVLRWNAQLIFSNHDGYYMLDPLSGDVKSLPFEFNYYTKYEPVIVGDKLITILIQRRSQIPDVAQVVSFDFHSFEFDIIHTIKEDFINEIGANLTVSKEQLIYFKLSHKVGGNTVVNIYSLDLWDRAFDTIETNTQEVERRSQYVYYSDGYLLFKRQDSLLAMNLENEHLKLVRKIDPGGFRFYTYEDHNFVVDPPYVLILDKALNLEDYYEIEGQIKIAKTSTARELPIYVSNQKFKSDSTQSGICIKDMYGPALSCTQIPNIRDCVIRIDGEKISCWSRDSIYAFTNQL